MTLFIDRRGRGTPLALLHGWGLHGAIWQTVAPHLESQFELFNIDLPGHGYSAEAPVRFTLETVADAIVEQLPARAILLGWSLGGLIALDIARRYPDRLSRLVLVAATPRFARGADWPHGIAPTLLAQFAAGLTQDYRATLQRFLSLQIDAHERETLRALRAQLFARGEPAPAALAGGLEILRDADLRANLAAVHVPTLIVHGTRDRLVPFAAGEYLARHLMQAQWLPLANAGHAPFLSQAQTFAAALTEFAHERPILSAG